MAPLAVTFALAQEEVSEPSEPPPLRVGIAGSPPFVSWQGEKPSGLSVDVWEAVADKLSLSWTPVPATNADALVEMVRSGQVDIGVGPVSITADRAREVAFTQPYYQASLGILARASRTALDRFRPFMTRAFLTGGLVFSVTLLLVGTVFWLAERTDNDQFPMPPLRGVGNGVWMALVTMTTVGYGDLVPRSGLGRTVAGVWMLASALTFSSLTAFLATALTLSQIDEPSIAKAEELAGRRIGVPRGTTSQDFAAARRARLTLTADLDGAVEQLIEENVDAVVFDRPMLRYQLKLHPDAALQISDASYDPVGYGFALPLNSTRRTAMDVAILALNREGRIKEIVESYLGP